MPQALEWEPRETRLTTTTTTASLSNWQSWRPAATERTIISEPFQKEDRHLLFPRAMKTKGCRVKVLFKPLFKEHWLNPFSLSIHPKRLTIVLCNTQRTVGCLHIKQRHRSVFALSSNITLPSCYVIENTCMCCTMFLPTDVKCHRDLWASLVNLQVLIRLLWKEGPASNSSPDIYPSTVLIWAGTE